MEAGIWNRALTVTDVCDGRKKKLYVYVTDFLVYVGHKIKILLRFIRGHTWPALNCVKKFFSLFAIIWKNFYCSFCDGRTQTNFSKIKVCKLRSRDFFSRFESWTTYSQTCETLPRPKKYMKDWFVPKNFLINVEERKTRLYIICL